MARRARACASSATRSTACVPRSGPRRARARALASTRAVARLARAHARSCSTSTHAANTSRPPHGARAADAAAAPAAAPPSPPCAARGRRGRRARAAVPAPPCPCRAPGRAPALQRRGAARGALRPTRGTQVPPPPPPRQCAMRSRAVPSQCAA
ncbi:hypothetical protein FGB62_76g0110 [Gracilaria domingensis]|nr:hypothetical protein FGB62_76g0110 [Gracilaria domingensis]